MQAWKTCATLSRTRGIQFIDHPNDHPIDHPVGLIRGAPLQGGPRFVFPARWVVRWIASFV